MTFIQNLPILFTGRATPHYMHPAVTELADGRWLMTLQTIHGSDHYGPVGYTLSTDAGLSWTPVQPIAAFATTRLTPNLEEGIADVRSFRIPGAPGVAAFGCNTYYTGNGALSWDKTAPPVVPTPQYPVYSLFDPVTGWGERRRLTAECFAECSNWRTACTQIATTPENDWILPVYFAHGRATDFIDPTSPRFAVRTLKARLRDGVFDVYAWSNVLENHVERGMIEPSVLRHGGGYYLTLRAEDGHGYWCRSDDALSWSEPQCWRWTDGEALTMSSTQQHWVALDDRIFLVYTRRTAENATLMRYRAPLFIAEFDPAAGGLRRASEQTVFPMRELEGMRNLYGNFHCSPLHDGGALISDCACFTRVSGDRITDVIGEVHLARLRA